MKKVGIIMGSDSDLPVVEKAIDTLVSQEILEYDLAELIKGLTDLKQYHQSHTCIAQKPRHHGTKIHSPF